MFFWPSDLLEAWGTKAKKLHILRERVVSCAGLQVMVTSTQAYGSASVTGNTYAGPVSPSFCRFRWSLFQEYSWCYRSVSGSLCAYRLLLCAKTSLLGICRGRLVGEGFVEVCQRGRSSAELLRSLTVSDSGRNGVFCGVWTGPGLWRQTPLPGDSIVFFCWL